MAWLTGWTYRKSITLARASGVVTNYQMKLLIGESSGATGEDVDCGGHCLSTFNDLRFTTSDGTTLLDYWIESISGTTPNQLATVWIEFDSIGTSDTTFYMYYGNSGASAASNGANTFIVFDDFERGNDGDTIGGLWTETVAHAHISTAQSYGGTRSVNLVTAKTPAQATIPVTASDNVAIQMRLYKEDAANLIPISYGNGFKRPIVRWGIDEKIEYHNGSVYVDTGATCTHSQWCLIGIRNIVFSSGKFDIVVNDTVVTSGADMYTDGISKNVNRVYGNDSATGSGNCWIDNFIVRNWRSTEPAWGTWGAEYSTAEYYSVSITADPLSVTASLSGTPWPSLQQIIPAALSVTAGLLITSVSAQMVIAPAALSATAELSCGDITSFASANIVTTYECYLSKPTYADLALPMSSFQGRFKSGDPSMLSVVIPGEDLYEDINDRSGGTLKLYIVKTAASNKVKELLIAVTLEDIRIDKGTENISISLSGHATVTYTPKIVVIKDLYYENIINGLRRWRFNPYVYLRPGDTVYIDGSTIVADDISWSVSENSFAMECAERTGGGTALDTTAAWVLKADSSPSSGGALAM